MINLKNIIINLQELVWSLPVIFLLIFTHLYFTIKLKFPQRGIIAGLKYMFKFKDEKIESNSSGISSYKALMSVLAATLGTGNIIGIATAIAIGGIGSIFWIFVSGIIAIATKYAETYIVLKYRKKDKNGYYGGTMYVLSERIDNKLLGILFSIFLIIASFGIGAMIQSNSAVNSIITTFKINKRVVAIIITILCTYVIFGNEKRISNISSILVPLATFVYLFMCIALMIQFRNFLIPSIIRIVKQAFNFRSATGGILSSIMIASMSAGFSKGLFSNEAGMGSSPIFDCTVRENNISKQSLISSTAVFIDTVILCTITGIILVSSSSYLVCYDPIEMVNMTFSKFPFGEFFLTFSLVIFSIATIPCWGYYGSCGVKFLFKSRNFYMIIYKLIYAICIYMGAIFTLDTVWSLSAIANGLMILPNIYMLFKLSREIKYTKKDLNKS